MDDEKTIEVATDCVFGLMTSTISIMSPALGIVAIASSPILSENIKSWLKRFVKQGKITEREFSRLSDGLDGMSDTLNFYKEKDSLRTDSLLNTNKDGFCDADDIFESMINHINQDSEKKKASFCGNFIGSLPYTKDLSYSNLMQYSRIISQLSYSELCLINIFCSKLKNKNVCFLRAEQYVKQHENPIAAEILIDILHMRGMGLIQNVPPYNLGANVDNVVLSLSGERLYNLMRLNLLDSIDVDNYWEAISTLIES